MQWKTALALVMAALAGPMSLARAAPDQPSPADTAPFIYRSVMIPMRDGVRLETVILTPRDQRGPLPILFSRTPYGVPDKSPAAVPAGWAALAKDGYIFVDQSMRGRFGSQGDFTFSTRVDPTNPAASDEATDAYDSIDWLVRNVPNNNGRVGMWGTSYPGLTAAIALTRPHPALKAVSPQAAWIDYWQNDDLHRNGALRLSYAVDWLYMLQDRRDRLSFYDYKGEDTYTALLKAGSVADIGRDWFKGRIPMFQALIEHPSHDAFYRRQRWIDLLGRTRVPTLNVAGYWDQEDPWGSWRIYERQERDDPDRLNMMVVGPWNHGYWGQPGGTKLGSIDYGVDSTGQFISEIEAPFFRYWLHGLGPRPDFEVKSFQSGSWTWQRYPRWPAPGAVATSLYLRADGTLSFIAPPLGDGCRSYVSDPANPVPNRPRPVTPTYPLPAWGWWEAGDQRFLADRKDVLSWVSTPLAADLTVTGAIMAQLMASTTGTDTDFVVKLIDVYPDTAGALAGYKLPIAMEVRRGRFLASDTDSRPLVPGKITAWPIAMRDHDHVFLKGHRIMVQIQSSWFPVIDRNPQRFLANPYKAAPADFVKAINRICAGSRIELPIVQ